ncbi:RIP metalloprotease RseP [Pontixanthobacter sp. CEM42]|uniref:RIP metalloprotease RseP n=1 Tax=Pontixanthobacter sp. CEM42 TaxID=2792077 RepID=UPI001FD843B0|nr:RIP metalloprotease RseP [Pontixanthobacter sp. CEM42]
MFESVPIWMMILGFLLVLGPLVTVHELGHYLVGRWFGVKADAFSVGFGKELVGRTDKHGTRWKLSALPIGGYVQFRGDMNPASIPDADALEGLSPEERDGSFHHAALWKRALIVLAGPVTNILVALGIFAAFSMIYGKALPADPAQQNIIASFAEVSAAREAGLEVGDKIVAVNDETLTDFRHLQRSIALYPGETVDISYSRGGDVTTVPVTIGSFQEKDRFGNESKVGRIGIAPEPFERVFEPVGPIEATSLAVTQSLMIADMMVTGIKQILTGARSVRELGGPIKIAKYSGEQLSLGMFEFTFFVALISLNLAFINLLPIPALDGGHLAFYAAEAIRRKPVGPVGTEWAYRTGVALVLMLMIFVTANDVVSLFI